MDLDNYCERIILEFFFLEEYRLIITEKTIWFIFGNGKKVNHKSGIEYLVALGKGEEFAIMLMGLWDRFENYLDDFPVSDVIHEILAEGVDV